MKIQLRALLGFFLLLPLVYGCASGSGRLAVSAQSPLPPGPYVWKSVQIVGGGFVDGIVFHPTARGVRYCRTDIGGAYRWDDSQKIWVPILDWVPYKDTNLMGVESIAVDPSDANRVYLACGMYTNATSPNAAILRSDDQGSTFQRTDVPFKMGGNEDGRGNGERLAVDPNDGNVIYFGSRLAGLWRSTDRAVTWSKVTSFPNVTEPPSTRPVVRRRFGFGFPPRSSGIVFEIFDPRTGSPGKASSTIYAGVSLINRPSIFRSTDGGQTWQPVPGQPQNLRPSHGVWASNGVIYFSYGTAPGPSRMTDGAIWKFSTDTGVWTDITPEKSDAKNGKAFGYGAVAVDAANPDALIASTFGHPNPPGEELYRSTDGGESWRPIFRGGGVYDYSNAPYVHHTPIHWLLDIQIDPCDPNHAMFTTGYGGWETFDLTNADAGKPTHWSIMSKGIEETVALHMISPPAGPELISAIGDYGSFDHPNLDKPPADVHTNPRFGNTTGLAMAATNPQIVVRVGGLAGGEPRSEKCLGYSLDGGQTWRPAKTSPGPNSREGQVAVNADGTRWIWSLTQGNSYLTTDHGDSWKRCEGLPEAIRTAADPVNPMRFYAVDVVNGQLFTSADGGATFQSRPLNLPGPPPQNGIDRGDARGGQDQIYPAPDREGDLWLASYEGLYRSNAGASFVQIPGPVHIHAFGFGKAAPGSDYPALYLIGDIASQPGIFRSDDVGKTWLRINDDQHQYGLLLQITGDPRIYGRVYVGTHGRGILYGDPR
jgi:hypothetical protein